MKKNICMLCVVVFLFVGCAGMPWANKIIKIQPMIDKAINVSHIVDLALKLVSGKPEHNAEAIDTVLVESGANLTLTLDEIQQALNLSKETIDALKAYYGGSRAPRDYSADVQTLISAYMTEE